MYLYYINLDNAHERGGIMKKQLNPNLNIQYKRIAAIIGESPSIFTWCTLPPSFLKNIHRDQQLGRRPKLPLICIQREIGCLVSHLKAIKTAYDDQLEEVIITEDDIDLTILKSTYEKLISISQQYKNDFDVLQLYSTVPKMHKQYADNLKSGKLSLETRSNNFWGAQAYLIKRSGMEKIMNKYYDIKTNKFNLELFPFPSRLVADLFIYITCITKITSLPFVNILNPESIKSCIIDHNYKVDHCLQHHLDIKNATLDIIRIINNTE